MSDDFTLRIAPSGGNETSAEQPGGLTPGERQPINEQAELLADLLAARAHPGRSPRRSSTRAPQASTGSRGRSPPATSCR
jgi:hypothetical protein